ncbi:MAG: hypothetical protein BV457_06170 [Thermoplasmata archaeon M9B1D]|nr:MAG: hypothetical protein BV457_06170 [Thermoplasmata archaeon M9B1D]PNX48080.1 MAG: hypothetical protein BV456_10170 [Thermoplasmata archaeon M8B2D]
MEVSKENQKILTEFKEYRKKQVNNKGNKNSQKTLLSDKYCLEKFANFLGNKSLKEVTKKDLKEFLDQNIDFSGYNLLGGKLKVFYRWIDDINGVEIGIRECPKIMKWWRAKINKTKDSKKLKEEELISDEEYGQILNACTRDRFGMWEAMWETFWLSGARLGEVASMKIKDVTSKDGNCTIYVPTSKTESREIPLPEYPFRLERWVNNHPHREEKDTPLWVSLASNNFGEPLVKDSIAMIFWKLKKRIGVKDTISVHNFRKTRATKMFSARSKDGGLIYSDKQIALFFGWSPLTVSQRRKEYDLSGVDELKKTVFGNSETHEEGYDIQKKKYEKMKDDYETRMAKMEKRMKEMQHQYEMLMKYPNLRKDIYIDPKEREDLGENGLL